MPVESSQKAATIVVDDKKCISCGVCVTLCPHNALSLVDGLPVVTGKCRVCGLCASSCITKAITMKAKKFTDDGILSQFKPEEVEEPRVVVFSCRRLVEKDKDYGKNVSVISLLCSARLDTTLIVDVFRKRAWGVIVATCGNGCRNQSGSVEAKYKVEFVKKLFDKFGIGSGRIVIVEGKFEDALERFVEELKPLGEVKEDLEIIRDVTLDRNVRALVAKMRQITEEGNVYGERIPKDKFEKILEDVVSTAVNSARVSRAIGEGATVSEIAKKTGLSEKEVLDAILEMKRRDKIAVEVKEEIVCYPKG